MAVVQWLPRQARTGRIESANQIVNPGANRHFRVMSDIGAADLADSNKWVAMMVDVQDATVPGGWRLQAGGGVTFQCGPVTHRDGTVNAAGENRGFQIDAAELAGKTVRGVMELRDFGPTGPFGTMDIGVTFEVLP